MPANPFINYRLPKLPNELTNRKTLLDYLQLGPRELRNISARRLSMYGIMTISKRDGGTRSISAPQARLKFLQHRIKILLDTVYNPKNCVHGFVDGKSALTNAQEHLGRSHIVKVDLEDFFGTITSARVRGLLRSIGISDEVASVIVIICTLLGKLPQGSPASPILSNMICFGMDNDLLKFARANRLRYSRYADDIVLSSFSRPRILRSNVQNDYTRLRLDDFSKDFQNLISGHGFSLNLEKSFYLGPSARRAVTGYTINQFANVPRRHVRRVRSILHNIRKNGYATEQVRFSTSRKSLGSLKKSLRGQIEWIGQTKGRSDPVFRRYALEYNSEFSDDIQFGPDLTLLAQFSTWVLEATDHKGDISQGTAFFLDGVGLVTAAHCVPANTSIKVFNYKNSAKRHKVTIQKTHSQIDLAILNHAIPVAEYLELKVSSRELNVGEDTKLWGFPAHGPGKQISYRMGKVVSIPTLFGVPLYNVDQKINQGNSGGPLLDSHGEVVGVAHKGGPDEAFDLAVKISQLALI